MKWNFIFGETEKDLSPIFSSNMVSITMGSLWLMGIILILTWPYRFLFQYLEGFQIPPTFLCIFVSGLIMISYLNLRSALGEIIPDSFFARLEREGVTTFEEERDYLTYGFPQSLFHTLVFHLLLLPFLIIGAAITGIPLSNFFLGLAVLFTSSLLCRQVSFFLLLTLGRWQVSGYVGARLFYFIFLFATAFIAPFLNPVLLLVKLHYGERVPFGPVIHSLFPFFVVVLSSVLFFLLLNQGIIRRNNRKRSRA